MLIQFQDFNGAGNVISGVYRQQWDELYGVLANMPLHLKAIDQAGIQGNPIFDPVGTNQYIADALCGAGWNKNVSIPTDFKCLGTDVDFEKRGAVVEVQFSNYPFLLNNLLRSELFYREETAFVHDPMGVAIIVTKSGMFPASQSTLYYEQALEQLSTLARVFTVPVRLVGLFESVGQVNALWTDYSAARTSRTVGVREVRPFNIENGRGSRCKIEAI